MAYADGLYSVAAPRLRRGACGVTLTYDRVRDRVGDEKTVSGTIYSSDEKLERGAGAGVLRLL